MKDKTWCQEKSQDPGDSIVGQGQRDSGNDGDLGVN